MVFLKRVLFCRLSFFYVKIRGDFKWYNLWIMKDLFNLKYFFLLSCFSFGNFYFEVFFLGKRYYIFSKFLLYSKYVIWLIW